MAGCCCFERRGDFSKCILIYAIGFVFLIAGIPMMIVGIAGSFQYADLIGYIGGVSVFAGILFLFVWHMITIPVLERKVKSWDTTVADLDKDATKEEIVNTRQSGKIPAFHNLAYQNDVTLPESRDLELARPLRSESSSSNQSNGDLRQGHLPGESRPNSTNNNANNCSNVNPESNLSSQYDNLAFETEIATISGREISDNTIT